MIIELKPHVAGYRSGPLGIAPIEFDQWMLMIDGVHWGYVPKRKGAHIAFIRRGVTPEEAAEVKRLVEAKIGERSKTTAPPELPETDTELDEEDYDDDGA